MHIPPCPGCRNQEIFHYPGCHILVPGHYKTSFADTCYLFNYANKQALQLKQVAIYLAGELQNLTQKEF